MPDFPGNRRAAGTNTRMRKGIRSIFSRLFRKKKTTTTCAKFKTTLDASSELIQKSFSIFDGEQEGRTRNELRCQVCRQEIVYVWVSSNRMILYYKIFHFSSGNNTEGRARSELSCRNCRQEIVHVNHCVYAWVTSNRMIFASFFHFSSGNTAQLIGSQPEARS